MKSILRSISQIERDTLEEIFRKFGCAETPFLEDSEVADPDFCEAKDFLTVEGAKAYEKLVDMLYDLGKIAYDLDPAWIVDEIDKIITCR